MTKNKFSNSQPPLFQGNLGVTAYFMYILFLLCFSFGLKESPLAAAAFAHGELLPEAGLLGGSGLFGGLLGGLQHVEQVGLDAGLMRVELHVPLVGLVRLLAVDERLLQVAHHLLADRLLHRQVPLDVLPFVVFVIALVVVLVCTVLLTVQSKFYSLAD